MCLAPVGRSSVPLALVKIPCGRTVRICLSVTWESVKSVKSLFTSLAVTDTFDRFGLKGVGRGRERRERSAVT